MEVPMGWEIGIRWTSLTFRLQEGGTEPTKVVMIILGWYSSRVISAGVCTSICRCIF